MTIAICFDKENFVLHKHGRPEKVYGWYNQARTKFINGGFPDMADNLVVIEGAFPVEEVNKYLSNSSYIEVFWKKLNQHQITSAKHK